MISHRVAATRARSTVALVLAGAVVPFLVALVYGAAVATASETVFACAGPPNQGAGVMQGFETYGTFAIDNCPLGYPLSLAQDGVNRERYGQTAGWFAHVPYGLAIMRAQVNAFSALIVGGYQARFQWDGLTTGSSPIFTLTGGTASFDTGPNLWAGDFGFALACGQGGGCARAAQAPYVHVSGIQLTVGESPGYQPAFANGSGLWAQPGWVRGNDWSLGFSSSSPVAGICQESATLNGLALPGAVDVSGSRNQSVWAQCQAAPLSAGSIDTRQFGQGSMPLTLNATDSVGVANSISETVRVDNSQPVVSLSGASSASSTAGPQYVTATGGGSPSGIARVQCSVDGGRATSYRGAVAQVPVAGVGSHVVSCRAEDNAVDAAGAHGWSAKPAMFTMDIGAPTATGIWFGTIIHGLKCRKVKERIKVAGHWVAVHRDGKLVMVHRRARTKRVRVLKCRERLVKRRVTVLVKVRRDGKTVFVKRTKLEKVPLRPKAVNASTKRVPYGTGTTVSGLLASSNGTAVPGQTVQVLTAPDNQLGQWSQAAVATTGADGTWSASLPPGPSRLVEATYAGDSTMLPSMSSSVTLLVPARINISITPHQLPWSKAITIRGHLVGGYVPPDGVALRLLVRYPGSRLASTLLALRTNPAGAFKFTWSYNAGRGVATYRVFVATTATETDFPFSASRSRRIAITFGRQTPVVVRQHHKHHGHHHKKHHKHHGHHHKKKHHHHRHGHGKKRHR